MVGVGVGVEGWGWPSQGPPTLNVSVCVHGLYRNVGRCALVPQCIHECACVRALRAVVFMYECRLSQHSLKGLC